MIWAFGTHVSRNTLYVQVVEDIIGRSQQYDFIYDFLHCNRSKRVNILPNKLEYPAKRP